MSEVGDALNDIALIVGEEVAEVAFPDTCTIKRKSNATRGADGGKIRGATSDVYTDIGCAYKPSSTDYRDIQGGQMRSVNEYIVTIPRAKTDGTLIAFDIEKDSIVTDARGIEPSHTFDPIAIKNDSGVVLKIVCEKTS